jgi:tetratricopeptide (TPR) repeat protein
MMDPRVLLVAGGIAGAAALQGPIGDANAVRRANDFRYTPDPAVMKVVAGAHKSTLADVLWLRALPDMSRPFNDKALKKRWLEGASGVVTDLEPTFGTVYLYGAAHLNIVDKNPDAAIALLTKGIQRNPQSAGLHVQLAMVYFEYKKDRAKTIELLEMASSMPDMDTLSMAMLAAMKVDSRDDFVAIAYWAKALEDAHDPKSRDLCEYELWRTKLLIATRAARDFEKAHGAKPKTPADLRDEKLMSPQVFDVVLDGLVLDAAGHPSYGEKMSVLVRRVRIRQAVDVTAVLVDGFREEGAERLPTEKEFLAAFGDLPAPPPGQKWVYRDGKLSLVAE